MSANSFAALRKSPTSDDLKQLADQHLQHDLEPSDREALKSAAGMLSTHATYGSLIGLGLGLVLAWRLRGNAKRAFEAFKMARKPTHLKFADGTEEPIPSLVPLLQPTTLGDITTFTFFGIAGLFVGGETGILTGASSAQRTITQDAARKERVERAYRAFRADVLRRQLAALDADRRVGNDGKEMEWSF